MERILQEILQSTTAEPPLDGIPPEEKKKKKSLIVYIFVAATAVLPSLKRLGVTHQTHHGRRPLWSIAAPQLSNRANRHQTGPQKSTRSIRRRTCHQFWAKQQTREWISGSLN